MEVLPTPVPVTVPAALTVAIDVFLEDQTPPPTVGVNDMDAPLQTVVGPEIVPGDGGPETVVPYVEVVEGQPAVATV